MTATPVNLNRYLERGRSMVPAYINGPKAPGAGEKAPATTGPCVLDVYKHATAIGDYVQMMWAADNQWPGMYIRCLSDGAWSDWMWDQFTHVHPTAEEEPV